MEQRNLPKLNSNKKTHANTPNQPWPNTNHASIFGEKNIIFDGNHSGVQKEHLCLSSQSTEWRMWIPINQFHHAQQ